MANPVITDILADDILDNLGADTTGILDECEVFLYVDDINPTRTSVFGDFTEATFPGYARITVSLWSAKYNAGTRRAIQTQLLSWICTGTATETVYGLGIIKSGGTDLVQAQKFDTSVPIAKSGDQVSKVVSLAL